MTYYSKLFSSQGGIPYPTPSRARATLYALPVSAPALVSAEIFENFSKYITNTEQHK
jgi:hypothetical protein